MCKESRGRFLVGLLIAWLVLVPRSGWTGSGPGSGVEGAGSGASEVVGGADLSKDKLPRLSGEETDAAEGGKGECSPGPNAECLGPRQSDEDFSANSRELPEASESGLHADGKAALELPRSGGPPGDNSFAWFRGQVEAILRVEAASDPRVPNAYLRDNAQLVRQLLGLYLQIRDDPNLSYQQKRRLMSPLETQLKRIARVLRAELSKPSSPPPGIAQARTSSPARIPLRSEEGGDALRNSLISNGTGGGNTETGNLGGPPGVTDFGWELVELIEQVVSPHTWARNGGRGQIWYWAPGQALIVRQTDEVHRQIEDLLQQLRRAW